MKRYIVLSGGGNDRVGIVNRIAHGIAAAGGNIELQRSANLAGEFALIMLVSIDEDKADIDSTVERLSQLSTADFPVTIRRAFELDEESSGGLIQGELTAEGADQPGIIDAVTLFLVQKNINIAAMDYDVVNAPMTGTDLLQMRARLSVPNDVDVSRIEEDVEDLERRLGIRIEIRIPV